MASLRKPLTIEEVKQRTAQCLAESGVEDMKVQPLTVEQCRAMGFTKYPAAGFVIPYFDVKHRPTKFYRFRYVEQPGGTFGKAMRYVQPSSLKPEVYFSLSVPWEKVLATDEPLFITEGEKKAEKACQENFACLGLGGVFNFESKDETFIEALDKINWQDRRVYIVFDSDIHSNRNVVIAANRLAKQLLRRGAIVMILRLWSPDGEKFALDDLLVREGKEAFQKLLDEDAEEFKDSRELHRLNEHVLYVHNHSIFEVATGHRIRPNDFVNSVYSDWTYDVKTTVTMPNGGEATKVATKRTAKEWMLWPGRAKAPAYVYEPGRELILPEGVNDWRGWGCEPRKYKKDELELWHRMMLLIFGADNRKWFEQWIAYPLQHPGEKLTTAVLNWGRYHGTGKDLVAAAIGRIYGSNWIKLKERDIDATHNTLFEHKQFVTFEELSGGQTNRRVVGDVFKTLITQSHININPKFLPPYKIRDCVNYYVTSNHSDPLHMEPEDRRWFVNEVTNRPESPAFYAAFAKAYVESGESSGALFQYLLDLDLDGFEPKGHAPITTAKRSLIAISQSDPAAWATLLRDDPDAALVYRTEPVKLSLMTEGELLKLFKERFANDGKRSLMQRVLAEAGITKANRGDQIRNCGDWGKPRLFIVRDRETLEKAKEKDLAKLFVKERATAKPPFDKPEVGRKF